MLRKYFVLITLLTSLAIGGLPARAQDAGALLDLLVKKRIITDQEAEEVRGELTREVSTTSAGKLKLSSPLTELEIYGDARVRYEVREGNSGPPSTLVTNPSDAQQRNRHRYRLRGKRPLARASASRRVSLAASDSATRRPNAVRR